MASPPPRSEKLRVLLIPFFTNSHIGPFADLAFHLAAARPGAVEATVAVTPANVPVLRSALARRGPGRHAEVQVATYPFPSVDGLPPGVENHSTVSAADAWRIDAVGGDERLMRPGHEGLIRDCSPDVVVSDILFHWNASIADSVGVPCVTFHVIGAFPMLALFSLIGAGATDGVLTLPEYMGPDIQIPVTELPEEVRSRRRPEDVRAEGAKLSSAHNSCFGLVVNTFFDLEDRYCDMYVRHMKRTYFVGPVSLPPPSQLAAGDDGSGCIEWLDRKPARSVVYLCFGSLAHVSKPQLRELALGLEASGKPFLWVVRSEAWVPPEGWEERVGDRGMVVTRWAPQTAILAHPAVGAFVTHCGWNSVLETVVAGVPVLTWPMVFEQFITERFVTKVLKIGERLWPEGAGVRSTRYEEHELIPSEAVAQAVGRFMEPGGVGDAARSRVKELSAKAHAAMEEGESSHGDLRRLIDDLIQERTAGAGTTV
jgi:UDP:flavonoid glycosyltransferase YjiC (YdhE family)